MGIDIQLRVSENKRHGQEHGHRDPRLTGTHRSGLTTLHSKEDAGPSPDPDPRGEAEANVAVPSLRDLATSYLQSEPREERLELEAALSSRANVVQHSTLNSQHLDDELGIGPDGGISLPTFLTGFFQGLADRLHLVVRDIAICVSFNSDEGVAAKDRLGEPMVFMQALLKIGELGIDELGRGSETLGTSATKRHLNFSQISVELLSEFEEPSSMSVNKGKGRMQNTHTRARKRNNPNLPTDIEGLDRVRSTSSTSSMSTASTTTTTRLQSSGRFDPPPEEDNSSSSLGKHEIMNQLTFSRQSSERDLLSSSHEDLTESRIFTREEAESMYLSALSGARDQDSITSQIPGAWSDDRVSGSSQHHRAGPRATGCGSTRNGETFSHNAQSTQGRSFQHSATSLLSDVDQEQTPSLLTSPPSMASSSSSKEILSVASISIWLPVNRSSNEDNLLDTESYPAPAAETARSNKIGISPDGIAVQVSTLSGQIDLSSFHILIRAVRSLNTHAQSDAAVGSTISRQPTIKNPFTVKITQTTVSFYENAPKTLNRKLGTPRLTSLDEPLFQLHIEDTNGTSQPSQNDSHSELSLSQICIVHGSRKLVAFDQGASLRESVKDVSNSITDVRVSITSTDTATNLEISTLPIQIFLDVPTIDDLLPRSGVLSSLLDIGSSLSTIGIGVPVASKAHMNSQPKSVRFETVPQTELSPMAESSTGKTNVRIQGLTLTLSGSDTAIKLQTSAIKVVHRPEGVGLQVDKANLSGPYFSDWRQRPALKVSLENTRLEYLQSPREADLDRLLAILSPSKGRFDENDDIMLDTLLRQRRKGPVLRVNLDKLNTSIERLSDLDSLPVLVSEMSRLQTVAKYLPEDDRPGILFLSLVKNAEINFDCSRTITGMVFGFSNLEMAHVSLPSLSALKLPKLRLCWRETNLLLGETIPLETHRELGNLPMVMCKYIGDEMDPAVKIKLYNITFEYSVSIIMAFCGLDGAVTGEDLAMNLTTSLANLEKGSPLPKRQKGTSSPLSSSGHTDNWAQRLKIYVTLRDCTLGLNPRGLSSKCLILLSEAKVEASLHKEQSTRASLNISQASVMVADDVEYLGKDIQFDNTVGPTTDKSYHRYFVKIGYIPVGSISSAAFLIKVESTELERLVDVEIRDDLLILETAADSTQTLVNILNGLRPPMPVSEVARYRTEVLPIEDMLASLSGDAFISEPGPGSGMKAPTNILLAEQNQDAEDDIEYVSEFYPPDDGGDDSMSSSTDDLLDEPDSFPQDSTTIMEASSAHDDYNAAENLLDFQADHFGSVTKTRETAHRENPQSTSYGAPNSLRGQDCSLRVRIRDVHVIWNLFDGYDWQRTRDQIAKAVQDVQERAQSKNDRTSARLSPSSKDEEDTFIGDCLFNSVYVGIPANRDPKELTRDINRNIDDLISETGSHATTSTITPTSPRQRPKSSSRPKKLRLMRSKHHKMTFEFSGISAELLVFSDSTSEIQSSVDVRVHDLVIFDHVPTSTWKKFATYMLDAGERESGTSMVHMRLFNVRPVPDLAATEIVLKINVLPLRLHVDQDALDFMSRFFEFKDEGTPSSSQTIPPFFQRVEINPVKVKLDFKPKRVDYGGLRSGRTTEFMNFFVLDAADMVLRRVILYGVSGFDRLGQTLNDIWMPDVKRNQLPGILAGLSPVRSLVNVGGGVKDLVVIPMREYQKDGRIFRSVQKGAFSFAKTTTKELVKLGAKLALGTQTVLQNTETLLAPRDPNTNEEDDAEEDIRKKISLYADQPLGVVQGLRGAYASLERDLVLAKDAIVAVPGEVIESGSAGGAARAMLRQAPTVVLRPAIGVSKAIGQTLLGTGNSLDRQNLRRAEEVSYLLDVATTFADQDVEIQASMICTVIRHKPQCPLTVIRIGAIPTF